LLFSNRTKPHSGVKCVLHIKFRISKGRGLSGYSVFRIKTQRLAGLFSGKPENMAKTARLEYRFPGRC
jgi:hypothetical protein